MSDRQACTRKNGVTGMAVKKSGQGRMTSRWITIAIVSMVAGLGGAFVAAPTARASIYNVAQCSPGHAGSSAALSGSTSAYEASSACDTGGSLRVSSAAAAPPGASRQWVYTAPAGTQIEWYRIDFALVGTASHDGNRSILFHGEVGKPQNELLSEVSNGNIAGVFDSDLRPGGPYRQFGIGMVCTRTSRACASAFGQQARLGGVAMRIRDATPPVAPSLSGPALDGWVSGAKALSAFAADVGAGIDRLTVAVNGTHYDAAATCNPGADGAGYVTDMTPCPAGTSHAFGLTTTAASFQQGATNSVQVCAREYGAQPATKCASGQIKVDNAPPAAPRSLELQGGQGWRRDNDFDLSWSNPAQDAAPITGAVVRLTGPGGYDSSTSYSGAGIERIADLEVPAPGHYTAEVRLVDAAGNSSTARTSEVDLKFDDTVPPGSEAESANGWVSRDDLRAGFRVAWGIPREDVRPPSGIAGYRMVIDRNPTTNPCAATTDPRVCGDEMTEIGLLANSRNVTIDDVAEGVNYVHVVPISGSGVRASAVGHTPLKVDLTAPALRLNGVQKGWTNKRVRPTVVASDLVSGMSSPAEIGSNLPPATFIQIGDVIHDGTSDVEFEIAAEGRHEFRYWARDLAGNVSESRPAEVKIDMTAPDLAFMNAQDPKDPDRLVAPVADRLSGIASGEILFRRVDQARWRRLETSLREGKLIARADSASMRPGVAYEFIARATDRAGNVATASDRADGKPMRVVGPFKTITKIDDLRVNGKQKARTKVGKRARISGRIVSGGGSGIGGVPVELDQQFARGSKRSEARQVVISGSDGRFEARLPKGPSRQIGANFAGDRARLPSASEAVRLRVKSGIVLKVAGRAKAGGRARFRGRVRAPGVAMGKAGKRVEIQVRVGKRWKAVGRSIRTNRRGAFRLAYRFVANYDRPVRFTFRAVALRESGFPYLPSKSKRRYVTVRP